MANRTLLSYFTVNGCDFTVDSERTNVLTVNELASWKYSDAFSEPVKAADTVRWNGSIAFSDTVKAADAFAYDLYKYYENTFTELLKVYEGRKSVSNFKRTFADTVKTTELYAGTASFKRAINETVKAADAFSRTVTYSRILDENVGISDVLTKAVKFERSYGEAVVTAETAGRYISAYRHFIENAVSVASAFDKTSDYERTFRDTVETAERVYKATKASLAETVKLSETLARRAVTYGRFAETVAAADALAKTYGLYSSDGVSVKEANFGQSRLVIAEGISIAESLTGKRKYSRVFNEAAGISETYSAHVTAYNEEAVSITVNRVQDTLTGVLSSLIISQDAQTQSEFSAYADKIPGYNAFSEFKVGDYEYQKAIYRIAMSKKALETSPTFYDYVVHVDIPDTLDRGRATIDGETNVYFNKHYYNAPEVNVTFVGGTEMLIPRILTTEGKDDAGRYFTVILENSSGVSKKGVISWAARGY